MDHDLVPHVLTFQSSGNYNPQTVKICDVSLHARPHCRTVVPSLRNGIGRCSRTPTVCFISFVQQHRSNWTWMGSTAYTNHHESGLALILSVTEGWYQTDMKSQRSTIMKVATGPCNVEKFNKFTLQPLPSMTPAR